MKILTMYATFGKLHEQTLQLDSEFNVFYGPNESGKSTWSAFIRAMLYGISTREKSKIGFLADKEKYAPWSGEPMYGKMEFLWQGKHCLMERRAGKNGILQKAKITDVDTGKVLDIPEPVGETLLGIRREVFERSAFIAQAHLAVNGDKTGELERKITALSTTGEEDISQKQVLERLEKWKRKLQYYKKGEIPELEQQEQEIERSLGAVRQDAAQITAYHTMIQERKDEEDILRKKMEKAKASAARQELDYLDQVEKEYKVSVTQLRTLENSRVITQEQWIEIQEKLRFLEEYTYKYTERSEKLQSERKKIQDEVPCPTRCIYPMIVSIVCSVVVFLCLFFVQWIAAVSVAPIVFIVSYLFLMRGFYQKYGVKNRAELQQKNDAIQRQQQFIRLCQEEYERAKEQQQQAQEGLFSTLKILNIPCSVTAAKQILADAEQLEHDITQMHQQVAQRKARWEAAQVGRDRDALTRLAAQAPSSILNTADDLPELANKAEVCRTQRERISNLCAALQERILAYGEVGALENTLQEVRESMQQKKQDFSALTLAIQTMAEIQTEMQRKFAPLLEKKAGELFYMFTGGHFKMVQIEDAEFSLSVSEHDAAPPRRILELSQGTLDELYLAVRLALCETVLSPEVPIILDDALVNFDDFRMERVLSYLCELSKTRQILLFTCHKREGEFAKGHNIFVQSTS